jgi:hypothetical protein
MWHGRAMAMPALRYSEEGLDLVEEFYTDENQETDAQQTKAETANTTARTKAKPKPNQGDGFVQDMQKGLQGV